MSLRFWTTLQMLKQTVLVEDGKIVRSIPAYPPKTIYRRAAVVCEYNGKLALAKHASFELWDREGDKCYRSFHHRLILAPHDIYQYGQDLLICSSGLEMFFIMDIDGNVKWEWWGYENGLGGRNEYYFRKDWVINQTTSDLCEAPRETQAHFNSICLNGDVRFLTAALAKRKIVEITIGERGFNHIANVDEIGCHSPFIHNGTLIYGTEKGIRVGGRNVLAEYSWVKYIRRFEDGFAFTHERGVAITDSEWRVKKNIPLPMPYKTVFMERY